MFQRLTMVATACAVLLLTVGQAHPAEPGGGWNTPAFDRAEGQRAWHFPQDHGQHPRFRLEWWYYTGILRTPTGREFGFQVTFFRQGVAPPIPAGSSAWRVQSLYLAHVALSDVREQKLYQSTRPGRDSLGSSGAALDKLQVWIGSWRADPLDDDRDGAMLAVNAEEFSLSLGLKAEKPPVLHGDSGLDRKGAGVGQASWYYSVPRLRAEGRIGIGTQVLEVTGSAWMDHEFGTNQLGDKQAGWDWFSIQLSDGYDLMVYRLRLNDGDTDPASHGTLIDPQGRGIPVWLTTSSLLKRKRFWKSSTSGGRYPIAWQIDLPEQQLSLEISPKFDGQEIVAGIGLPFAYWEGAISVEGIHRGRPVSGEGYLELTGYAGVLRESFR